jgi:hypothetical protein
MAEEKPEKKLGGNISLVDFELPNAEMLVVRKIIGNHVKKIQEKFDYKELKLRLKKHEHGKTTLYELKGDLYFQNKGKLSLATADVSDYNLFVCLDNLMKKLNSEIEHQVRKEK